MAFRFLIPKVRPGEWYAQMTNGREPCKIYFYNSNNELLPNARMFKSEETGQNEYMAPKGAVWAMIEM